MCDAFLQNYSSAMNNYSNPKQDIVPTIITFTDINCTGGFFPRGSSLDQYVSNNYTNGQLINLSHTIKSIFIPSNFTSVTFSGTYSSHTYTSTVKGPLMWSDLSAIYWQTYTGSGDPDKDMVKVPPTTMLINTIKDWQSEVVKPACMGKPLNVGQFSLTRFTPARERCDYFMKNQFCINDSLENDESCGCFKDLYTIQAKSQNEKVDLPVICFGENCGNKNTYKTASMLSKPCNITICEQLLNTSEGLINDSTQTIYCAGHFFQNQGSFISPTVTVTSVPTASTETNSYIWIIAISVVAFGVLMLLMFAKIEEGPKKTVMEKLKEAKKKSFTVKNPFKKVSKTDLNSQSFL
jgi:hypothetical protein